MAVQLSPQYGFDPNIITGPTRANSHCVSRMGAVTPGAYYGTNGQVEFATKLYIGSSGPANVNVMLWDGTAVLLKNLEPGIWHNICSIQIIAATTTATDIVWGS